MKDLVTPDVLLFKIPSLYLYIAVISKFKDLKKEDKSIYLKGVRVMEIKILYHIFNTIDFIFIDSEGSVLKGRGFGYQAELRQAYKRQSNISVYANVIYSRNKPPSLSDIKILFMAEQYHNFYPIYRSNSKDNNQLIQCLNKNKSNFTLEQIIPVTLLQKYNLMSIEDSIQQIHWPDSITRVELDLKTNQAIYSIAVEEILGIIFQNINQLDSRVVLSNRSVAPIHINMKLWNSFKKHLPFTLNNSQLSAVSEIYADLIAKRPMNRLLQGDVGSGKTVVFASAILQASSSNLTTCLLVPSTLLAQQHYINFKNYFKSFDIPIFLVLGSRSLKATTGLIREAATHPNAIIISTNFIWDQTIQDNTGLLIIDEQHKYGIEQRNKFMHESTYDMHLLLITATPIPRTFMMSLNGALDVTNIIGKPSTRKEINTYILNDSQIPRLCEKIKVPLSRGEQVYWICPRLESSKHTGALSSINGGRLQDSYILLKALLPDINIECVHGKMNLTKKEGTLTRFMSGETQILMGTSVVEVGLDVPNATVMIIEDANLFGLASLHQMRGRVGRRDKQSYCFLLYNKENINLLGEKRLQTLKTYQDGYDIAEKDLQNRGYGNILGVKQAGKGKFRFSTWEKSLEIAPMANAIGEDIKRDYPHLIPALVNRWGKLIKDEIK